MFYTFLGLWGVESMAIVRMMPLAHKARNA